jgi:predicted histone-like DNA-binding protein
MKTYGSVPTRAKYRVVPVEYETVGLKRISKHIQRATSLTPADVIGVLTALKEEVAEELKMGNHVHLPGIGYFSLAIQGELYEDPRSHHYRLRDANVRKVKFRPDMEFLEALRDIEFENITYTHGTSLVPTGDALDEAIEQLLSRAPFFTVANLQEHLHLSQSHAYRLVARLEADGKIRNMGTSRRKLYGKVEG